MAFTAWVLWAADDEAAKVSKAVRDPNFILNTLILLGVLLLAAILFAQLQKWRRRQFDAENPTEQLTSFRAMYESGELSKEEYDQIKQRMARRMRGPVDPARPAQPPRADLPPPIDLIDYE